MIKKELIPTFSAFFFLDFLPLFSFICFLYICLLFLSLLGKAQKREKKQTYIKGADRRRREDAEVMRIKHSPKAYALLAYPLPGDGELLYGSFLSSSRYVRASTVQLQVTNHVAMLLKSLHVH